LTALSTPVLTERAKKAGIKPTDLIVKVVNPNYGGGYSWKNYKTGEIFPFNPYKIPPQYPRSAAISESMFTRTGWIGLVLIQGQGATPTGVQLWVKTGTGINKEDASNAYIRRGGKFKETTGMEYFVAYDEMRGTADRYEPRKLGLPYRTEGEIEAYKYEIQQKFNITSNELEAQGFDWVNGFYPAPPGEISQYDLGYWTSSASLVNQPVNFGGSGGGSGQGSRGRSSGTPATPNLPVPAVTITTRMPKGYAGRGVGSTERPQMVQRYQTDDDKSATEIFIFRYIPQGIKYSGLSGNWVEVPRAEDIPFVDWASWQLMKVSFSFVVAADRTEPGGAIVPDGLDIPVDAEIEKLRRMAQRKTPVTLVNFDDMLTFQLRRGEKSIRGTDVYVKKPSQISGEPDERVRTTQPNMEFVISDFSVTATRRTSQQAVGGADANGLKSASMLSMISVAQCEITLTEIPVETVGIIALPPIVTPGLPTTTKKPPGGPNSQRYEFITDIMASPDRAYNSYIPNDNT
jgi:hypothetical protein